MRGGNIMEKTVQQKLEEARALMHRAEGALDAAKESGIDEIIQAAEHAMAQAKEAVVALEDAAALEAEHGADVDYLAVSLFDHRGNYCLRADKGGVEVNVDDLTELSSAHLAHGDTLDDSSVVNENVDNADGRLNVSNHCVYSVLIGYVANVALYGNTCLGISGKSLIYEFLLDVVEYDLSASLVKRLCDGESYTVGCAGYESDLALKRKHIVSHFSWLLSLICNCLFGKSEKIWSGNAHHLDLVA